ncbi:MAG: GlxA family transcriptional regulator, partial [Achromobacter pestifer]
MHDDAPSRTPASSIGGRARSIAPQQAESAPQRILFVLFDGFQPLDLAGPWQAFSSANEEAGKALYQLRTIAATPVISTWE